MKIKKLKILLFLFFLLTKITIHSQNVTSFLSPDTVCIDEPFLITNTSEGFNNFHWNFCGTTNSVPIEKQRFELPNELDLPVFMDIKKDGETFYAFVTNNVGRLVRLNFGNSLLNTPQATNLGDLNVLTFTTEAIQIFQDGENWIGFIIGGSFPFGGEFFIRLDFGNSLSNVPTVFNFGNLGELDYPHDLCIFKENENWFGWTINKLSNSLTRFSFGNSLLNNPSGENIGNIGNLQAPCGFHPVFQNGNWHIFVANEEPGSITRLDFGTQLSNTPTGINLGNLGKLQESRDILITEICGNYFGVIADRTENQLFLLSFEEDLTNYPSAIEIDNLGDFNFPHSFSEIFKIENDTYFFIVNTGNRSIDRIRFKSCNNAFPNSSTAFQPPAISYDEAGFFIIQLTANFGQPDQQSFCKEIVVLPPPDFELGKDTTICNEETFTIDSHFENAIWQDGTMNDILEIEQSGIYSASVTIDGCTSFDSIRVDFSNCDNCLLFPNIFTPDGDQLNDIFQPIIQCDNNLQTYELKIFNRWGQTVFNTTSIEEGWNGNYNNTPTTSDVYIWKVNYQYFDGEKLIEKTAHGDLTLVR